MFEEDKIDLDFTSLLDVLFIILFFFIMFSSFDSEQEMKKALGEVQVLKDETEIALADAETAKVQAEEELEDIKLSSERQGQNVQALMDFSRGRNVKLILSKHDNDWSITIKSGEDEVSSFSYSSDEDFSEQLAEEIIDLNYDNDDTILCELIYDASLSGSRRIYSDVNETIREIKKSYPHFYLSETDMSIVSEVE